MTSIAKKIPTMTDEQLLTLFSNVTKKLTDGANDVATYIKVTIEREWKKRRDQARAGQYTPGRPIKGMLAELGYRVGTINGEKTAVRRTILAHVISGELPMVGSPAYTEEWGMPHSSKRFRKLVHFFEGQLNNSAHANSERAMIEWREDLEWVRKTYAHLMQ